MLNALQVAEHYARTRWARPFATREALLAWQQKQLQRTLDVAAHAFPFYRPWAGQPYHAWPIAEKALTLDRFAEFNSVGIPLADALAIAQRAELTRDFRPCIGSIAVGLSTGTSGRRSVFLTNTDERLRWAGTILAKLLPPAPLRRHRIAFLFRANNHLYTTLHSSLIDFRYFDLQQPFDILLATLNTYNPSMLIGPGHVLDHVAKAQQNGHMRLSPEKVIAVAEVLEPTVRQRLESVFPAPVHQLYQATEGCLASTCREGTLHLHEDLLYFERHYLDQTRRRFIPIITDFYRQTQAIIRYRLTDLLIERATPCPCGSVLQALEQIEGRCDDVLFFPSLDQPDVLQPVFPDLIRQTIAKSDVFYRDFQIVQDYPDRIRIRLTRGEEMNASSSLIPLLTQLCQELRLKTPTIEIEYGEPQPIGAKFRRVIRQCATIGMGL